MIKKSTVQCESEVPESCIYSIPSFEREIEKGEEGGKEGECVPVYTYMEARCPHPVSSSIHAHLTFDKAPLTKPGVH